MTIDKYIAHSDLAYFADEKVNLKKVHVTQYRQQVNDARDRLKKYIDSHPDFDLVKMLHSGSVAKGTALSTIGDMDVAVYLKKSAAPSDERKLLEWMADRLKEAYGGWKSSDDFKIQHHCVTVHFHGTGLDVDMVPVLYEGDPQDKGYLIAKHSGERVLTSIPLHLEFTRKRKLSSDPDYRQIIRFLKWWKRYQPGDFRFKSFMIELIVAHLVDRSVLPKGDYVEAILSVFNYIAQSELKEQIIFTDYYARTAPIKVSHPIQIFDPVNPGNNVAALYTDSDRQAIVDAARDAVDAINYGRRATTKAEAESAWREILGPSFKAA